MGDARSTRRDRSSQRGKVSKGSERKSRRWRSRSRARSSFPADSLVGRKVREARLAAWLAGEDESCYNAGLAVWLPGWPGWPGWPFAWSLRDKCENCYAGSGTHVPRHQGRARQDLGTRCYLPRRAPGCDGEDGRNWARDCANRARLDEKMRRRY